MKPLAFRIYPEPHGYTYYETDLANEQDVEILFDYCQILEATIWEAGWQYLISRFGYDTLYKINTRSGWFNSESVDEFISDIKSCIAALPGKE